MEPINAKSIKQILESIQQEWRKITITLNQECQRLKAEGIQRMQENSIKELFANEGLIIRQVT